MILCESRWNLIKPGALSLVSSKMVDTKWQRKYWEWILHMVLGISFLWLILINLIMAVTIKPVFCVHYYIGFTTSDMMKSINLARRLIVEMIW